MPRLLYLGLDPSRYSYPGEIVHYPIIQTLPLTALPPSLLSAWPRVTHLLFTSPRAVDHWFSLSSFALEEREVWAIGPGTAAVLHKKGVDPLVAPVPTQEGVVTLLHTHLFLNPPLFLWPRSSSSRPLLSSHLSGHLLLDLYCTLPHKPGPLPDQIDEILFTSPSTVHAFVELFGSLPTDKKLKAIGPITQKALASIFHS